MGLIPRLHFGDGLHTENALVKKHGGRAYLKIINTRDIDKRIVAPEVDREELDKIATNRLKNSNPCNKDIETRS